MAKSEGSSLTDKQRRFCEEYLIDLNATQAAIRAGYSAANAESIGYQLLQKTLVSEDIKRLQAERADGMRIDAEYVLRQAVKLHERCMQEIVPFTDRKGEQVRDENGNPLFVFDAKGAASALSLIGKHVGVQAFREQLAVSGLDALADRLERASKRAG